MNINGLDALNTLKPTASATGTTTSATKSANSDKNTFMTLLVEQLKHQDPLAPQDGAQFVAQLAQFNSLEQLVSINQELGQLLTQQKS